MINALNPEFLWRQRGAAYPHRMPWHCLQLPQCQRYCGPPLQSVLTVTSVFEILIVATTPSSLAALVKTDVWLFWCLTSDYLQVVPRTPAAATKSANVIDFTIIQALFRNIVLLWHKQIIGRPPVSLVAAKEQFSQPCFLCRKTIVELYFQAVSMTVFPHRQIL